MNIPKKMQIKVTFLVFTLLFAVILSGAASAALAAPLEDYPSAYVAENNYSFTGPASIQDAIDNYETLDGYNVQIEAAVHYEQLTINKNLSLNGLGAHPHYTVIQSGSENATITIGEVNVVLENLSIWNTDNGQPIANNGLLTILNCYLNGLFIQNQVTGSLPYPEEPLIDEEDLFPVATEESDIGGTVYQVAASTPMTNDEESFEITSISNPLETTASDEAFDETFDEVFDEVCTGTTSTEGATNYQLGNESEKPAARNPGLPFGSLAYGMLMVMGGTVACRKHQ
jgi:hypothetical protein